MNTQGLILLVSIALFCLGWTFYWGFLLIKRRRWFLGILLWLVAFVLITEVGAQIFIAYQRNSPEARLRQEQLERELE